MVIKKLKTKEIYKIHLTFVRKSRFSKVIEEKINQRNNNHCTGIVLIVPG